MGCNFELTKSIVLVDTGERVLIVPYGELYNVSFAGFQDLRYYKVSDKVTYAEMMNHRVVKHLGEVKPYLTQHGFYRSRNVSSFCIWLYVVKNERWYHSFASDTNFTLTPFI